MEMNLLLNRRPLWIDAILMVVGTGLMALAIQCIYDPVGLVTGGFTGVAIIAKYVTKGAVPLWLTNLVLNVPLFLLAALIKGKKFVARTAVATVLLSAWLYVIPLWNLAEGDYVLSAIFGGVICGVGMGMVLLARATTGGTDMLAALIQHKLRHYTIMQIICVIDGIIVAVGIYSFGVKAALYAIVAIYVTSKVSDTLMEGMKYSKAVFIVSDRYKEISDAIMTQMDRGVTGLDAVGMYSGDEKCMLYCVVSKKEIVVLKEIILKIDNNAFVIVTDAREVVGEGFLEY
jgi:uncharacterized membrane-anchored protein YitT (DUF2179 family)